MEHRLNAKDAIECGGAEGQSSSLGESPGQQIPRPARDTAADIDLPRVNIDTGQMHAVMRIVEPRERAAKPAPDIEHRLTIRHVCELHHHSIEMRLCTGEVAVFAITPIPKVHGALRQSAAKRIDQAVEVRWQQRLYPQQYVASRPRDNDMKLQAVQRLRAPPTGETLCR